MQLKSSKGIKSITAKQNGAALLMLMLAILLIVTVGIINIIDPEAKRTRMEQRTQESLARAKEALIAYAVSTYDLAVPPNANAGILVRLPCPDTALPEGVQNAIPTCVNYAVGHSNAIGMLPWATLNMEAMRDSSEECLWYALSGSYKSNPSGRMLNEDSPGQLLLYAADGNTLISPNTPDRPVAAIFAPGSPLPGQNRNPNPNTQCGGNYNAPDFLEAVGVANNAVFSDNSYEIDEIAQGNANSDATINDRVITISRSDIWTAIRNRRFANRDLLSPTLPAAPATVSLDELFLQFTWELAECIANYGLNHGGGDLRLPWAVPVNGVALPNWYYGDNDNYADFSNTYGGRFPFTVAATAISAGYAAPVGNIFTQGQCARFLPGDVTYPLYENLWIHWKDHVFYGVSAAFAPNTIPPPAPPGALKTCVPPVPPATIPARQGYLSVNCNGNYAAIVMFAGSPLLPFPPFTGQVRDFNPDPLNFIDDKAQTFNYLDDFNGDHVNGNAAVLDAEDGSGDYQNLPGPSFNDILVCIDQNLAVVNC